MISASRNFNSIKVRLEQPKGVVMNAAYFNFNSIKVRLELDRGAERG